MYNIIAIGDPVVDTHVQIADSSTECSLIPHGTMKLCLDFGSKIQILNCSQILGGNAANFGIGTAKLGLKTAVISTIGNDVNGKMILKDLADRGVDTSIITTDESVPTKYNIVLNYCKERTILSYSHPREYAWPRPMPATDWIYYTSLSEGFETIQKDLMKYLQDHQSVKLAFNPGSHELKFGIAQVKEMMRRADILIVNLEEAEEISGTTLEEQKSVNGIVRELLKMGSKEVVITDGERGAWAGNDDDTWHMKPYPVAVVGKTGAGDSFSAGYVAARFYGHDINHALGWGVANSASVIQYVDSHSGLLNQDGIQREISSFKTIQPLKISALA